jgi:hypothetical protein
LYISEPVDEEEENIADFFSCPVSTFHLGVHTPNRVKVTSVSEHLAGSRHQRALKMATKRAYIIPGNSPVRIAESNIGASKYIPSGTFRKQRCPLPSIQAEEASFLLLTHLNASYQLVINDFHDHCVEATLANIEEIDESIYLSEEDCCPHTLEIIEHVYNQLSIEQLHAMSDERMSQ